MCLIISCAGSHYRHRNELRRLIERVHINLQKRVHTHTHHQRCIPLVNYLLYYSPRYLVENFEFTTVESLPWLVDARKCRGQLKKRFLPSTRGPLFCPGNFRPTFYKISSKRYKRESRFQQRTNESIPAGCYYIMRPVLTFCCHFRDRLEKARTNLPVREYNFSIFFLQTRF